MTLIDLTDPVAHTLADAALIANNNALLENVLNGNIDSSNIKPGSVSATEIADGSITTPKIADGAVTYPKIAAGLVPAQTFNTTPPSSPAFGDLWHLTTADSVWTFSNRAALDSTYPWYFLGGQPRIGEASPSFTHTGYLGWRQEAIAAMGVPRGGYYDVSWSLSFTATGFTGSGLCYCGIAVDGVDPTGDPSDWPGASFRDDDSTRTIAHVKKRFLVAAGGWVQLAIFCDLNFALGHATMELTPMKVG